MAQLSRKARYQELRDQIEKEAMETQMVSQPVKLSRVQNSAQETHANKPVYPHENKEVVAPTTNEVIDQLLGEVKQYNIDNGNRYTDDTQINILKQLDGNVVASRNQHIMPMEEEDEALGRTMEMPRTGSFMNDITAVQSYSTTPKLSRASQIVEEEAQPEVYDEFVNEEPVDLMSNYFEDAGEKKIVLSSNDISSDDMEETDHLDLFDPAKYESYEEEVEEDDDDDEEEVVSKRKLKKQQKKAAKKAKKEQKKAAKKARREEVEEEVEMPSSKMRMQAEDFDDEDDEPKSGIILNVILILLIIALVVSIGFTIYFLYNMGK